MQEYFFKILIDVPTVDIDLKFEFRLDIPKHYKFPSTNYLITIIIIIIITIIFRTQQPIEDRGMPTDC